MKLEKDDGTEAAFIRRMQVVITELTSGRLGSAATVLSSQSSTLAGRIVIRRCRDEVGVVCLIPFVIATSLEVRK